MRRKNVGEWLPFAVMFVFTGCAVWDQAIIAVDDAIKSSPSDTPVLVEQENTNKNDGQDEVAQENDTVQEQIKEPEPDCPIPPLPTQRTLERLGCLWKPVSESDRNLVVLLNREARTHVVSCEIVYTEIVYHRGRFSGDEGNGCRVHHRFGFRGAAVASGSFLVYKINGEGGIWTVAYWITDPANRTTWGGPTSIVAPDGTVIR